MYKFYEIFKIFNNCSCFEELERACQEFCFLISNDYIIDKEIYDYIVFQSDNRFCELSNI